MRNGNDQERFPVALQLWRAWSAGTRRQEGLMTSLTSLQEQNAEERFVPLLPFHAFKLSRLSHEYRFPLGRVEPFTLGWINTLRCFLYLRGNLRLWQHRLNRCLCFDGWRRNSGKRQTNVVKRRSKGASGNRRTDSDARKSRTIDQGARNDFSELQDELALQGASRPENRV